MKIDELIQAFALPEAARVEQHVPRKMLLEQGAMTEPDKRHFQEGIKDLLWAAEIKPAHIGVPAFRDAQRDYLAIAMVRVAYNDQAKVAHLTELIHRAIPYPLILVGAQRNAVMLSLCHKHHAHGRATGRVALEYLDMTPTFREDMPDPFAGAFLASLPITAQPKRNLFALYQGWLDRSNALAAARISGQFTLLDDTNAIAARRAAMQSHVRLQQSILKLRAQAEKEKQRSRQMEINQEIEQLELQLLEVTATL